MLFLGAVLSVCESVCLLEGLSKKVSDDFFMKCLGRLGVETWTYQLEVDFGICIHRDVFQVMSKGRRSFL